MSLSSVISRMPRPPPPAIALSAIPAFACFLKKAVAPATSTGPVRARQHRHLAFLCMGPRPRLVAEQLELLGGRADEGDPGLGAGLGERRILRQEPVAGMDGIALGGPRRRDHAGDVEIGRRTASLERVRLVDPLHMQRGGVVLGMDADRGDAELGGGLGDSDGDLAAIGDQELLDHVRTGS
jgi:hypothetical protein